MNKDLMKFILRLFLFGAVMILAIFIQVMAGIFIISCQYQNDYMASALDKIARLKSVASPKIILVGDSNLSFGINSKLLEDAMNMPVVNLGLHGGLSNAFHENMAKNGVKSGDIVIICHTHYNDNNELVDISLAWQTVEYHRELMELIRQKDYMDMIRGWPKYWLRSFLLWITFQGNKTPPPPYSRAAFNEYGDVVDKPESMKYPLDLIFKPGNAKVPGINDICINRLNRLNRYVNECGAVLLVSGMPIGLGKYTPPAEEYVKFQEELAEKLDCDVISDFRDYFIPYEYFYNTAGHLDERGTEIRTLQLIKDIKKWQAENFTE